jgi:hypothetical protein
MTVFHTCEMAAFVTNALVRGLAWAAATFRAELLASGFPTAWAAAVGFSIRWTFAANPSPGSCGRLEAGAAWKSNFRHLPHDMVSILQS